MCGESERACSLAAEAALSAGTPPPQASHLIPNKARRPPLAGSMPRLGSHSPLLCSVCLKFCFSLIALEKQEGRKLVCPQPAVNGQLLYVKSPAGQTGSHPQSQQRRVDKQAQQGQQLAASAPRWQRVLTPRVCPQVSMPTTAQSHAQKCKTNK